MHASFLQNKAHFVMYNFDTTKLEWKTHVWLCLRVVRVHYSSIT